MTLRRAIGWGLIGTFAFAALAIGTVHPLTRAIVFALSAALLAVTLVERMRAGRPMPLTIPTVALGVAVLATAAQLVPLPAPLLGALSPTALEILGPGRHPLSLDPPATVAELAKLCAYFAFYLAAVTFASRSHRRRQLVVGVAALATVVAVVGLVQAGLGARRLLFFYTPDAEWATFVRGTFVNPNHFGGLLCLGAPCALAIAICEPRLRWPAWAATFVMNVAVVFSLARAAIAGVLIGQAVVFALDRMQLRRGRDFMRSRAATLGLLALAIAGALTLAVVAGRSRLSPLAAQIAAVGDEVGSPLSKFGLWRQATALIGDFPWTGVGRGAFEPAFTRVSEVGGFIRYQWVENGYLETLVDWGVPIALLLFLLAGWAAFHAVRRLRDEPLAMGPLAALFALAVHEAADFSIELPGVALPALALLATLLGRGSRESEPGRRRVRARAVFLALPVLLLAPAAWRLPSAEEDAGRLSALARDPSVATSRLLAEGTAARDRHPSDYYLRLVVAQRLARELHPESLRWLNAAMYLNPTHPLPHLMAGEVLAATGHKAQALVEYKLAVAGSRDPRVQVWPFAAARYPAAADLIAATPDDPETLALLAEWLVVRGRPDDARAACERALVRDPGNRRVLTMLARLALDGKNREAARSALERLIAVDRSDEAQRLRARERILAGDLRAAEAALDGLGDRSRAGADAEIELARALAGAGRADAARERLGALLRWPLDRAGRAAVHEARAEIERAAGNEHQYRWEMDQRERLLRP